LITTLVSTSPSRAVGKSIAGINKANLLLIAGRDDHFKQQTASECSRSVRLTGDGSSV